MIQSSSAPFHRFLGSKKGTVGRLRKRLQPGLADTILNPNTDDPVASFPLHSLKHDFSAFDIIGRRALA